MKDYKILNLCEKILIYCKKLQDMLEKKFTVLKNKSF
jgi:hypothetical protein